MSPKLSLRAEKECFRHKPGKLQLAYRNPVTGKRYYCERFVCERPAIFPRDVLRTRRYISQSIDGRSVMTLLPNCYARIGRLPVEFGSDLEDAGIAAEGISRVVEQRIADCGVGLDVAQEVIQGVCVVG